MSIDARPLALVLAGVGAIGRRHLSLVLGSECARLAGIADPAPSAAALAGELGVQYAPDLATLIARVRPDAAIVATPTGRHVADARTAIAAGLPLLIEKPLAPTAAEAFVLAREAAAAGVPILVGHHRRHNPLVAAARTALVAGRLGTLVAAQALALFRKPDAYFEPAWRRQPGAGPVLTNTVHDIDLIRHLLGEIRSVLAVATHARRGLAVEDGAAAILTMDDGLLVTISVSDAALAPWSWELTAGENPDYPCTGEGFLRITGTEGALELPTLRLWTGTGTRDWTAPFTVERLTFEPADPLALQLEHFLAVARGCAQPLVGAYDGAVNVAVVEAIARSATSGRAERPPAALEPLEPGTPTHA